MLFSQNAIIIVQENASDSIVCKISAICSGHYVLSAYVVHT